MKFVFLCYKESQYLFWYWLPQYLNLLYSTSIKIKTTNEKTILQILHYYFFLIKNFDSLGDKFRLDNPSCQSYTGHNSN